MALSLVKDESANGSSLDKAHLLQELIKMYDSDKAARLPFERQWYLNLAFYFGRQYVIWTSQGLAQKLWEPSTPDYRVKLVSNKCKTVCRTEIAKMMKERPRGYVLSNTTDDKDKAAARAASQLYDSLEQPAALNLPMTRRNAYFWTSVLGNGFTKQYYDKNKDDWTGTKGSLVVEALSPFSIFVSDILEPCLENQDHVTHVAAKPVKMINKMYGQDLKADSSSTMASGSTVDQRFILAMGMNQQPKDKNFVTVRETWIKPCSDYPKGLRVMWTQEAILDMEEKWPYKHNKYPFTKYDAIMTGRFYNDSILVDFIPLQKEYNKSISQLLEIRNSMSKPGWLIQKGSVNVNMVTNQPGQFIEFMGGMEKPTPITPPPIPSYVENLIGRIQSDMNDTSGQHEITKGATPNGVTAATAISYLQEEDDSKLAPTIQSIEEGTANTASQLLSMFSQFCTTERAVKITGNNNSFEVKMFKASTLAGNTDYRVEHGSAMPRSRAARQAFILELQERGVFKDPTQMLKYLDMTETSNMYEEAQRDTRQADKENLMIAETKMQQTLDINDYDNHIVHITNHQNFEKTEQFDVLDDVAKQLHKDHVMLHAGHICAMYGRSDLLPKPITDPVSGQPVVNPQTGKPNMPPTDPAMWGFIEAVQLHGPPPPIPPAPPPQIGAGMFPGAGAPMTPQPSQGAPSA